jgi:hypothetical protein
MPKEFQSFFDILGGALASKSEDETSNLEWNDVIKPMLDLHLASKFSLHALVQKPVDQWLQGVSAIKAGSH